MVDYDLLVDGGIHRLSVARFTRNTLSPPFARFMGYRTIWILQMCNASPSSRYASFRIVTVTCLGSPKALGFLNKVLRFAWDDNRASELVLAQASGKRP